MKLNPIPGLAWVQALADNGQWIPPPEWAQDYPWMDQLPRARPDTSHGLVIDPPAEGRLREENPSSWLAPPPSEWTDIPDWLRALNADQDYERSRVIESPYGGWGGGAMQARRRGLR